MNKSQIIEFFKRGGSVRITTESHKFFNVSRKAEKIQTNAVKFEPSKNNFNGNLEVSWLYFKDIIPTENGFKISDLFGGFYEYVCEVENE